MKVFLALDEKCVTERKMQLDMFGGSERFLLKIFKPWLEKSGHTVAHYPQRDVLEDKYDVAIHSNIFDHRVRARRSILWCGSWHGQGVEHADVTIVVSQLVKDELGWKDAIVMPVPFDHKILIYKSNLYQPGLIMCHSNPNRHIVHTEAIAKKLKEKGEKFTWLLSGGNRLYSDDFHEQSSFIRPDGSIQYLGIVPRKVLLQKLTSAHVWAYPVLSVKDETFCVAAAEALALGIPTVLPRKEPFRSVFPEAEFALNEREFAYKIECLFQEQPRWDKDMSRYDDRILMPKYLEVVEALV